MSGILEKVRKFVLPDPEDDYAYSEEGYDDIQNGDNFSDTFESYYSSNEPGMDLEQEFLTQPASVASETHSMNSGLNNVIGMPNSRIWGSATEVLVMEPRAFEEMPHVIQALRDRYGLGQPIYIQYLRWITNMLQGDFGHSMEWDRPVWGLLWERLPLTFVLSFATLLITWIVAFPIGVFSAVKQYSIGDYIATFIGFLGLATPDFLLALVLMWIFFAFFNQSVGGLFSPEFVDAPWNLAKLRDLLNHLWIPTIIIALEGTAGLIRVTCRWCGRPPQGPGASARSPR